MWDLTDPAFPLPLGVTVTSLLAHALNHSAVKIIVFLSEAAEGPWFVH